ncbi:MAG: T9SS type A sorting domain-containing protein [Bacteroidales bacterium]|nr:T9SS type A sorting domain-containing protein [Bacteroidales bacterium]
MKKALLILCFQLLVFLAGAQYVTSDVLISSGDYVKNKYASMQFTIGEVVTETVSSNGIIVTQGFNQTNILLTQIDEKTNDYFSIVGFPNPAMDRFTLIISSHQYSEFIISMCDNLGQIISQQYSSECKIEFDLSDFVIGTYYLKVSDNGNSVLKTLKIQKY